MLRQASKPVILRTSCIMPSTLQKLRMAPYFRQSQPHAFLWLLNSFYFDPIPVKPELLLLLLFTCKEQGTLLNLA